MNWVDWLIVAVALLFAGWGYAQGFIVGALSLAGFVLGAVIGARLAPLVLSGGSHSAYAPLVALVGALLLGGSLASLAERLGITLRLALRIPGLRMVDGILGAGLTACIGLGVVWIVGAVTLATVRSPTVHRGLARSAILRDLDKALPPSGPILNALSHFDPLPSLSGPYADVPRPSKGILAAAGVRAAFPSVVRVIGTACGLGIEGSGWVAAPDLVMTNAHVVAGERDTSVEVTGIGAVRAHVILFDPHNDVAVLHVPGVSRRALSIAATASSGTSAAILGYPQDGPFQAVPGRLGITKPVLTNNAYGSGPTLRVITALRGLVRPGNSGGPLIDSRGRVVAMAFARITNAAPRSGSGGFAVPVGVMRSELATARVASRSVSTQGCAE